MSRIGDFLRIGGLVARVADAIDDWAVRRAQAKAIRDEQDAVIEKAKSARSASRKRVRK